MMLYTAIGQGVYIVTGPLIGRLFTPEQFGLYGLFYAFFTTTAGLMLLSFDMAIPAAQTDDEARHLTIGAAVIAGIMCPLAGFVVAAFIWADVGGFGNLPRYCALLVAIGLLLQSIVQLQQNWKVRHNDAVSIGKASVVLNIVRGASQVVLGLATPLWWTLAVGEIAGRVANAWYLGRGVHGRRRFGRGGTSVVEIRRTLGNYRQFPLVLLPSQMLDSAVNFIQSAGIAYFFGPAGLGIYFLMRRTLDLPVAFAFRSLSDVFYARQALDARLAPERVRPFFVRSAALLAGAGLLAGIPFMIVSPALFAFVFGSEWREAGVLAAIMAPASIVNLAVAPVARVFALTTRPQLRFCFSVVNLAGTLIAFAVVAHASLDLAYATLGLSVVTFIAYLVYFAAGYVASSTLHPPANASSLV